MKAPLPSSSLNEPLINTHFLHFSQMLTSVLMGHCTCALNIVTTLWAVITVTATWDMSYNLMGLPVLVRCIS